VSGQCQFVSCKPVGSDPPFGIVLWIYRIYCIWYDQC